MKKKMSDTFNFYGDTSKYTYYNLFEKILFNIDYIGNDLAEEYLINREEKYLSILATKLPTKLNSEVEAIKKFKSIILHNFQSKWEKVIEIYKANYETFSGAKKEWLTTMDKSSDDNSTDKGTITGSDNFSTEDNDKINVNRIEDYSDDNGYYGFNSKVANPIDIAKGTRTIKADQDSNNSNRTVVGDNATEQIRDLIKTNTHKGNITTDFKQQSFDNPQEWINNERKLREFIIDEMLFKDLDKVLFSHIY